MEENPKRRPSKHNELPYAVTLRLKSVKAFKRLRQTRSAHFSIVMITGGINCSAAVIRRFRFNFP
ncbi:Hypothetical predicted protein [Prunus dulcis]|uniref:Uncharacterized protein n=1 Tax=Prunus dulcis TaxID=3755 RepID=A0A5E4FMN0_PRUDU|nr:Hypothetical predicted protein [Prunus dulcis]